MRRRLLDLYCGGGGAAKGYHAAGFDVIGIDNRPQPNYPFEFLQMDAVDALRNEMATPNWWGLFDVIHASPPCPRYSSITPAANREDHPDLVGPTRELLKATGLPWVMENVVGAPMLTGFVLCGSMFGLRVRRHRLFESSHLFMPPVCDHASQGQVLGVYGHGGGTSCKRPDGTNRGWKAKPSEFADLMEMPWATPAEIVQAIPPAYTSWIGAQLIEQLERAA